MKIFGKRKEKKVDYNILSRFELFNVNDVINEQVNNTLRVFIGIFLNSGNSILSFLLCCRIAGIARVL